MENKVKVDILGDRKNGNLIEKNICGGMSIAKQESICTETGKKVKKVLEEKSSEVKEYPNIITIDLPIRKLFREADSPTFVAELPLHGKKYFEFSEKVRDETGIIGYERTMIRKEDLNKTYEGLPYRYQDWNKFGLQIVQALSEGEFTELLIHQMGWYALDDETNKKYYTQFVRDKFLLQKLFDPGTIKSSGTTMQHYPQHGGGGFYDSHAVRFGIFDHDLKLIKRNVDPKDLPVEYSDHTICSINSGLATISRFSSPINGRRIEDYIDINRPIFAFDPKEQFLHEYLKNALKLYENINQENTEDIAKRILGNTEILLHYKEFQNRNATHYAQKFLETKLKYDRKREEDNIPIIMNHPDIPHLRWGNAKYAAFFTDKYFNFLRIDHVNKIQHSKK
ncbi:MAG: hypothetical protein ACK4NC_02930 [Candidatus Gracilibacteria bacterium]